MAKPTFMVKVIREGRYSDYYDFWLRNVKRNASGEELHSDLVGFVVPIEAMTKAEAIGLVREKYPGLSIDMDATSRIG